MAAELPEIPTEGRDWPALFEAILEASRALDRDGVVVDAIRESFARAVAAFGAEKAALFAVDEADPLRISNLYVSGLKPDQVAALERGQSVRGVSSSLLRRVHETRQAQVVEHPSFTRPADQTDALRGEDYSVICAPVLDAGRERVVALMYFQNSGPDLSRAYRHTDALALDAYVSVLERLLAGYVERRRLERELEEALQGRHRPEDAPEIIGTSPETTALRRKLHEVFIPLCDTEEPDPILVVGETGTGKDLVARYIHAYGARSRKPFVVVNCAEITDELAAARFSGHKRGAFTHAVQDEVGFFRAASGGVLFLDEIGELSERAQAALLRAVDTRTVVPVGETKPHKVDVLLVLATNRDLDRAVDQGTFKRDFLARFAVQRIELPPLRERPRDIPPLVDCFIRERERRAKKRTLGPTQDALKALVSYPWPDNVRELRNVCSLLVTHARPGAPIDRGLIERAYPKLLAAAPNPRATAPLWDGVSYRDAMREFRRELIRTRIERTGSYRAAWDSLGVSRSKFYHWLRELGLGPATDAEDDDPDKGT